MPVSRFPTGREMISYATLKMKEDGTLHRLETKWWYEKGECGSDAGHRVSETRHGAQHSLDLARYWPHV